MAGASSLELNHCTELAMTPGSLFEFTSRFLPTNHLEPLLSVYALKQAISTIPQRQLDDSVKWAKLKWWSEELIADPASPNRHPVLRALRQSGARKHLSNALLQQLINNAVMQIDATPDSDSHAMFERFAALGTTDIQLELALDGAEISTQNLNFLAAASRLFHMISSFAANHRSDSERLPLSILAKYNINAEQLEQTPYPAELTGIIVQLTEDGLDWFSKGMTDLEISPKPGLCTHLQLCWAMEKRCLAVIRKDVGRFLDAGKHFGPADAWFAWRFLRRVKHQPGYI